MTYQEVKERILDIEQSISHKIGSEAESLKAEYISTMEDDYADGDSDDYDSFEEYLEAESDDFVEFHFGVWIETLLQQLVGVTKADWEALEPSEREQITLPYMDKFKELSGLGQVSEDL